GGEGAGGAIPGPPAGPPAAAPAPGAAGAPEAPAPEGSPEVDVNARFAKLEADFARSRADNEALRDTLRLLAPQPVPTQSGPPPLVRLPRDAAQRIAATLGGAWNEDAAQSHAPIFAAFMQELAAPLLVGIEAMPDTGDLAPPRPA